MNAHQKLCYRLLVRNYLIFRPDTPFGKDLPENNPEKNTKLTNLKENYLEQYYSELSQIANIGETPIFLKKVRTKTIENLLNTVNI